MLPWFTRGVRQPVHRLQPGADAPRAPCSRPASPSPASSAPSPDEIYFTSGGTESDNWAILGTADAQQKKGTHLITSTIEHHAVLETMEYLEKRGCEVTRVPVDSGGLVDPEDVRKAIRPDTILVSIMHANNEVGTIQPIAEIGKITREAGVLFHSDAVQTAGKMPLDVERAGRGHALHERPQVLRPQGRRADVPAQAGPHHPATSTAAPRRRSRRAGTLNVPGIVGMAKALELCQARMAEDAVREAELRDRLWKGLSENIEAIYLNGDHGCTGCPTT